MENNKSTQINSNQQYDTATAMSKDRRQRAIMAKFDRAKISKFRNIQNRMQGKIK